MAFRILTQVNYSAGQNPEGDSGLRFLCGLLPSLLRLDSDLHFYVLVPAKHESTWTSCLSHPRITAIPMDLEPRTHGGDFQFSPAELYRKFDCRVFDVDLLFLNQPETAPAFLQFFNRQMFHNVPAVSYVHWFDTRRPSTPKQRQHIPALLAALTGMLSSAYVGCNSVYAQSAIMNHAAKWFREDAVELLRGRIRVLTPGVDVGELMSNHTGRRKHRERAQILVNHRLLKYTGVRALLTDVFPELWRRRKDFQVVVTNPTRVRLPGVLTNVPWLKLETLPRPNYIRALWDSDIVVAPHRATYWSISTMEAICAECVPLMNRECFFAEMLAAPLSRLSAAEKDHIEQRWFFFRGSIVDRLSDLIDNLGRERRIAKQLSQHARQIYDWDALAGAWLQIFREAEQAIPVMSQSIPSMGQIIKMIRSEGSISKAEILRRLRWTPKQRALSWTAFRKGLKMVATEDSLTPEAIFQANEE